MISIPFYDQKFIYLYMHQRGKCKITGKTLTRSFFYSGKTDMHHLLENSKINRYKYPRLINSMFNLVLVNHGAHMTMPLPKMSYLEAESRERFLERHPGISTFLNFVYEGLV